MSKRPTKAELRGLGSLWRMQIKLLHRRSENRKLIKEVIKEMNRLRLIATKKIKNLDASLIKAPDLSKGWRVPK